MTTVATTEPECVRAGETLRWEISLSDYPASTWTLTYTFTKKDEQFTITATADGDKHSVTVLPAVSGLYEHGKYRYFGQVTDGTNVYTVRQGYLDVQPNLAKFPQGYDDRSHAVKVLEALNAMIEGKASKDQIAYSIGGRQLSRLTPTELLTWRNQYKWFVHQEEQRERLRKGQQLGGYIQVRM